MILPPVASLAAIEEGIKKGIKGFVIVSAGFREGRREGLRLKNRMVIPVQRSGVRLVGPNASV